MDVVLTELQQVLLRVIGEIQNLPLPAAVKVKLKKAAAKVGAVINSAQAGVGGLEGNLHSNLQSIANFSAEVEEKASALIENKDNWGAQLRDRLQVRTPSFQKSMYIRTTGGSARPRRTAAEKGNEHGAVRLRQGICRG